MKYAHIDIANKRIIKPLNKHPRADGGEVVGLIPGEAVVPVVYLDPPKFDYRTHSIERAEPRVEADRVTVDWVVSTLPATEIIAHIKAEANRIITERMPEWKQRNMIAYSVSCLEAGVKIDDQLNAIRDAWAWVQAVRKRSDEMEAAAMAGQSFEWEWPA